jgi:multiple sugar transport system substrate-binding protein
MKLFATVLFLVLGALSLVAMRLEPQRTPGKTRITWATDNNPVRVKQVELFQQMNPDIELVIDPANRDRQKVIVQAIAGVGPDVFDSYGKEPLEVYIRSGIAYDCTAAFREKGINAEEIVWPVARPSFVSGGKVYGFPCNVNAHAVWFNKNIFDEEGIPYPKLDWTWEDLIATAQKLNKRDARGKVVRFGLYWDWQSTSGAYYDLLVQFGGRKFTPDTTQSLFGSEANIQAIQLARDFLHKYKITPTPAQEAAMVSQGGWGGAGAIGYLSAGRVAMAYGGRWWLNQLRDSTKKGLRLGVVPLPHAKVQTNIGGARCGLVNAYSKNREAAIRFVMFLASPEYNQLLNDQADALAPTQASAYTERFLKNPKHPEEDYNEIWRDVVSRSITDENSMFAVGADLSPMTSALDLIKNNKKEVGKAMRDAQEEMNEKMRKNAVNRPSLGELWQKIRGDRP